MRQIHEPADLLTQIEERRETLGLSQSDLCRRARLSHGTYWAAHRRSGDMSLRVALAYCNVLGLTLKVAKGRGG